jgi:hypothetical protein
MVLSEGTTEKIPSDATGVVAQRLSHYATPGPVTDGYQMNIKTYIDEIIRGITKLNNSSYSDVRSNFNKGSIFQDKFFNQVWLPIGLQFKKQISVLNHMNVCPSIGPVSIN